MVKTSDKIENKAVSFLNLDWLSVKLILALANGNETVRSN